MNGKLNAAPDLHASTRPSSGVDGNEQSAKGGFYSELLSAIEPMYASAAESVSLNDEIVMLRLLMVTVLKLARGIDDLGMAIKVLNALGAASQRIMNLIKTRHALAPNKGDEIDEALTRALMQVTKEFNLGEEDV